MFDSSRVNSTWWLTSLAALELVVAGVQFEWGGSVECNLGCSGSGDVDQKCTSLNPELSSNTSDLKYIHGIRIQLF